MLSANLFYLFIALYISAAIVYQIKNDWRGFFD